MPDADEPSLFELAQQLDAICDRFETAWQEGQQPRIEDCLLEVEESDRGTLLQELLACELELLTKSGGLADETACCRRFPEYVDVVQAVFADTTGHASFGKLRDYELQQKLGEGGMGVVYKAVHSRLKRPVAIKLLPPEKLANPEAVSRFHREIEAIGQLDDPHIVRAHDAGEVDGTHYLVMEFIDGLDLQELQERVGPLSIADACEIVRQAALGLQSASKAGLVHRDIKPSNLMLTREGTVKILDLGLAHVSGDHGQPSELTATGQIMGTFDYLAPEQAIDTRNIDIRADIYSLGCTLFKLLTGRATYASSQPQTVYQRIHAHREQPIPSSTASRSDVPPKLDALLTTMLAKQADDRLQTPVELERQITPFCTGHDLPALIAQADDLRANIDTASVSGETMPYVAAADPRRFTRKRPSHSIRLRTWTAGFAASLTFLLFGTIVFVQTQLGTLEIETIDDRVRVVVSRNGKRVTVVDLKTRHRVRLWPGEYGLSIDGRDDLALENGAFVLRRREEKVARVVWRPATPASTEATQQAGITLNGEDWKLLGGASYDEFQAWLESLSGSKFRIIHMHGHCHRGVPQFTGIAAKHSYVLDWEVHRNRSLSGDQADFDGMVARGFRIAGSCGFWNQEDYESLLLWEKTEVGISNLLHSGLTEVRYRELYRIYKDELFDPVEVSAYPWHDGFRYTARFQYKQGMSFTDHLLTFSSLTRLIQTKGFGEGFRPISIFAHPGEGEPLFGIVMRNNGHEPDFGVYHSKSLDEFTQVASRMVSQGFRPDRLTEYSEGKECRYISIWVKEEGRFLGGTKTGMMPPELVSLDDVVERFMVERSIPAGALAVLKDGEVIAARGYGFVDRSRKTPTSPDTPFRLGDMSRVFTRVGIARLVANGKLTLDSKVMRLLDVKNEFDENWNEITVEHLLLDQGGWDQDLSLDPVFSCYEIAQDYRISLPLTSHDLINYTATKPLDFRPGTETNYSLFGYVVLGALIEKVCGKPYVEFIQEDLLTPHHLTSIQPGHTLVRARLPEEPYYSDPFFGHNVIQPSSGSEFVPEPDGTFSLESATASIGLVGTAADVAKFVSHYGLEGTPVGTLRMFNSTGHMPGSFAFVSIGPDGVTVVALFNQSRDFTGLSYKSLVDRLDQALDEIAVWPEPTAGQ